MSGQTRITQWQFDVNISSEIDIENTYQRIGQITSHELSDITETALDQHFNESTFVNIQRIILDLGNIPIETFETTIIEVFENQLNLELQKLSLEANATRNEESEFQATPELTLHSPLEVVIYYLLHGHFFGLQQKSEEINALFSIVIQKEYKEIFAFLHANRNNNHALRRFVNILTPKELIVFLENAISFKATDILFIHTLVLSLSEQKNSEIETIDFSESNFWEMLIFAVTASSNPEVKTAQIALHMLGFIARQKRHSLIQLISEIAIPQSPTSRSLQFYIAENPNLKKHFEEIVSWPNPDFNTTYDISIIASNYVTNGIVSPLLLPILSINLVSDFFFQWIEKELNDLPKLIHILVHSEKRRRFLSILNNKSFIRVMKTLLPTFSAKHEYDVNTLNIENSFSNSDRILVFDYILVSILDHPDFQWNDSFLNVLRTKISNGISSNHSIENENRRLPIGVKHNSAPMPEVHSSSTRPDYEKAVAHHDRHAVENEFYAVYYWLTEGHVAFWSPTAMTEDPGLYTNSLIKGDPVRIKRILTDAVLHGISYQIPAKFLLQQIRGLQPTWSDMDDHINFIVKSLPSYGAHIEPFHFDSFMHDGLQLLMEIAILNGELANFEYQFEMRMARIFGLNAEPSFSKDYLYTDLAADNLDLPEAIETRKNTLHRDLFTSEKNTGKSFPTNREHNGESSLPPAISSLENWLKYYLKNGCLPDNSNEVSGSMQLVQLIKMLFLSDANKLRNILSDNHNRPQNKLSLYEIILNQSDQISQNISYMIDDFLPQDVEAYFSNLPDSETIGKSNFIKQLVTDNIPGGRIHRKINQKTAFRYSIARLTTLSDSNFNKLLGLFENLNKTAVNETIYILKLIHSDVPTAKRIVQLYREFSLAVLFHHGQLPTHKMFTDFVLYLKRKSEKDLFTLLANLNHFISNSGINLPSSLKNDITNMQLIAEDLIKNLSPALPPQEDFIAERSIDPELNKATRHHPYLPSKKEHIPISNAGLILIHPFIKILLEKLHFTNGIEFLSAETQARALCLLHRIASPHAEIKEYNLTLPKLLCNYPLDHSPYIHLEKEQNEEALVQTMFDAIRNQWPKLKNTSTEGIQSTFLQRNGSIFESDEHWDLKVELTSIDILLQTLPWSIGFIKFPWMKKPIKTEWI